MSIIKEFQSKYGLTSDGVTGKNTLLKIKEVLGIDTIEMLAHFMGQCHVESAGFTVVMENMNYSKDRVLQIFKHDFDTNHDGVLSDSEKAKSDFLIGHPDRIADFVYANQNGNGGEGSGDGWRHRGFGLIQLTGKTNQEAFASYIKDPAVKANPQLIATKYPWESAAYFFYINKLWNLCKIVDDKSITLVSKRVNGGPNGLEERIAKTNYYYSLLKIDKDEKL